MSDNDLQVSLKKDVFLSHAHADKDDYVRPFAAELDRQAISYWLDDAEIRWGAKISALVNEGLSKSRFVAVFLTNTFVGRNWTEAELSAAFNRENTEGRTVVLPILIGDVDTILAKYPLVADKYFLPWSIGIKAIVNELRSLIDRKWTQPELEHYIANNVDINQFKRWRGDLWVVARGPGYHGHWLFWNDESKELEQWSCDDVIWYGPDPLNETDLQLVARRLDDTDSWNG